MPDSPRASGSQPVPQPEGEVVAVVRTGAVTTLVLNRPMRLNAIDQNMALALVREIEAVAADRDCRCLLITGAGRAFCAGQSLGGTGEASTLPTDITGLIQERYVPVVLGLAALEIPVVAAVNGLAVGAGFSLALAADIRIASEESWFSCAFAQLGLVPDSGASYFLPRLLGPGRALHYALTGDRITAQMALELGLVTTVLPPRSFAAESVAIAQRLAAGATRALGLTKLALRHALDASLAEQLQMEAHLQQIASETADFSEGLLAFREKRPPHFQGR
ncbi:MAG TPA: enoyl-CoA hydratase-related protein [Candidatus Nanopelagicaceae bacterium]|nr:enoyl-CoA hydratase-related protein [Candidatus Nanopelagicaceae bacterium]HVB53962.1 enoyl-CoA hydratase-related protein [Candidatus Acidoferrales bacterium]